MAYRSLAQAVADLEQRRMLVRIPDEVDGHLEAAEIQRRAYAAKGPAILFERIKSFEGFKGSPVPCVSNLFGTLERARFLLRDGLDNAKAAVRYRAEPGKVARDLLRPAELLRAATAAVHSLPLRTRNPASQQLRIPLADVPRITSWPDDGGPFITLPQVFTEDPPGGRLLRSNLGMYRVQLAGNEYGESEIGMHYQLHRGIGIHHTAAREQGKPLRVSIFVGGPPAHTLAAIMPLPEGLSELLFAGMLGGRPFRWARDPDGFLVSADADFTITGWVDPERTLPEGPFGDHLGYYSLKHPFPVLRIARIHRRRDAIWPFTVVGRPPQEDTSFGALIHEITEPMVPESLPGVHSLHAVDAAGVHPLLLAVGSERYVPFGERRPQELWTIANAILGFGQCSLAKYLFLAAREDDPSLSANDIPKLFAHVLSRADFRSDLHFQTATTIDTLDYSGTGLNAGSKLIVAGAGPKRRELAKSIPRAYGEAVPEGFHGLRLALPGIAVLGGPRFTAQDQVERDLAPLFAALDEAAKGTNLSGIPFMVLCDDPAMAAESLRNLLWVAFTRSNPSHDIHGRNARIQHKHWSCEEPLVIDARRKPHHAPPLVEDPAITRRVDALAAPGGPLHGIF